MNDLEESRVYARYLELGSVIYLTLIVLPSGQNGGFWAEIRQKVSLERLQLK